MQSIWDRANPQLRDLAVYQPGKPIEETARELGCEPSEIIKLASNENPLGPSPKAIAAMHDAIENAHLYPDGGAFYLRNAIAKKLNVTPDHIILGNGSNEIIELLAYGHDLDTMLNAITDRTELIFIANPNNPTGTLLSADAIERFMARVPPQVLVVFDEAYYEFVDEMPDTLRYMRDGRNVVTLRTFSKIHGLASLRVGYGIARPELIEVMHKTRQPFNVNGIGQIGALAALADEEHQRETKELTDKGRAFFEKEFATMKLSFVPSAANFVLVNVGDGLAVFRALLQRKVIVRAMKGYNLPAWVRITIGTMDQNRKCVEALRRVLGS